MTDYMRLNLAICAVILPLAVFFSPYSVLAHSVRPIISLESLLCLYVGHRNLLALLGPTLGIHALASATHLV
ncbi:hypothetical protein CVT26_012494 [Gymnopilus dilepis]|uniref:Uncharacterized protein n=1 Tax=Gymnopilus dilepis TaxID=231916 RepID=A0A409YCY1_9AGAR|nr:hypothetical protein CVT26_012494 [Gymnopilus dilepis]